MSESAPIAGPIWTATLTGPVDLRAPDPARINARAIAHGLSGINRWTHSTELPVSVAQHSEMVFEIFKRVFPRHRPRAVYALLHDAHEYVLTDFVSPVQRLLACDLPELDGRVSYWKARWDTAIRQALGVPEPDPARDAELLAAVHAADMITADFEWRLWMPAANGPSPFAELARQYPPHHYRVGRSARPEEAAIRFRDLLARELAERQWEIAA